MSLTDFFRINFPYGMKRNKKNEWFVFNREYMPLGWNSKIDQESIYKDDSYASMPLYTGYKGLTENAISKIVDQSFIHRDEEKNISIVFFYDDRTNPKNSPEFWNRYFNIIKSLAKFENKQTIF